jgi:hypothetical protein
MNSPFKQKQVANKSFYCPADLRDDVEFRRMSWPLDVTNEINVVKRNLLRYQAT